MKMSLQPYPQMTETWVGVWGGVLVCPLTTFSMSCDAHTSRVCSGSFLLERSDSLVGLGQGSLELPACPSANLGPKPRYRGGQSQGPCLMPPALPLPPLHTPCCSCAGLPGPLHPFNRHLMALAACQALGRHRRQSIVFTLWRF